MMRALCEPALPEQRVRGVIQALIEEDVANDLVLAKGVVDLAQVQQPVGMRRAMIRVLNQLERLTEARRIAPRLLPLLRHPDPQLRSKAVRMMGSCSKNTQWVARQLADPDARTRANAIEALWGMSDMESRELLRSSIQDPNNRIVGNVLLGLYRAGECASIRELVGLAKHPTALFRSSAAWVMGETADPRFKDALKALSEDPDVHVRTRAAASLVLVEAEAAKTECGVPWRMTALYDPPEREGAARRMEVAVQGIGGDELSNLLPTQFWIHEDDQPVLDYEVETKPVPDKVALALLVPAMDDGSELSIVSGALRVLGWKRFQDLWTTVRYKPPKKWTLSATLIGEVIGIPPLPEVPVQVEAPVFTIDRELAAQGLQEIRDAAEYNGLWDTIIDTHIACVGVGSSEVAPHLAIYVPCDPGRPPEYQMKRLAALDLTVPICCIARAGSPFLEELCTRSKGSYHVVGSDTDAIDVLEKHYVRQIARYVVTYHGKSNATAGYLHVRNAEGWAKASVAYWGNRAASRGTDWEEI
jgi:hypothetical protein